MFPDTLLALAGECSPRRNRISGPGPGRALDACTGTGDLALALADRVTPLGEVVGVDFAEEMLVRARRKAERAGAPVSFVAGDALDLPFPDAHFDAATVAFGARNLDDLDRGLRELARVVRPGGRVVVLEITVPERVRGAQSAWFDRAVPHLGRLVGGDGAAYAVPARLGQALPAAAGARRAHGRGRSGGRALADLRRRPGRPPPRAGGAVTSTVAVPAFVRPLAPLLAACEARLRAAVSGYAPEIAGPATETLAAGGKRSARSSSSAPRRATCAPARTWSRPRPRSSWCTWRRWSTTTSSTTPPCAADSRPWRGPSGRRRRSAPATSSSRAPSPSSPGPGRRPPCARWPRPRSTSRGARSTSRTPPSTWPSPRRPTSPAAGARPAALFAVACRLGALVGGAGAEVQERLARFGECVGLAFQIFDDILDLVRRARGDRQAPRHGPARGHGHPAGDPRAAPGARPRGHGRGGRGRRRRRGALRPPGRPRRRREARERALRFVAEARALVDGPLDGADGEALLEIADGVVDRYS